MMFTRDKNGLNIDHTKQNFTNEDKTKLKKCSITGLVEHADDAEGYSLQAFMECKGLAFMY